MEKLKKILLIFIEFSLLIYIYFLTSFLFSKLVEIRIIYFIVIILIVLYKNIDDICYIFNIARKENLSLFNTYYLNSSKVFEIAMLIDNRVKKTIEETYKNENKATERNSLGLSFKNNGFNFHSGVEDENYNLNSYEYKEMQEIKNTNSIYLRTVISKCKVVKDLNELHEGELIKIPGVNLKIVNRSEILQAKSLLSGVFNGNKLDAEADGQIIKIDINAVSNILLKDYKYQLIGSINEKSSFYVEIPFKANKELENDYSIYDLEIGKVNIIGIYRTKKFGSGFQSTWENLQNINFEENVNEDLESSKKTKQIEVQYQEKIVLPYIDLIAIVQDLEFEENDGKN